MPREQVNFSGDTIEGVIEQIKQAGATAVSYTVKLYDGEKLVGESSNETNYTNALLKAAGAVKEGVDRSAYRTQINVIAEKPSAIKPRAAGVGPREEATMQYTKYF